MKKQKVLFLVQLPPPVHGASLMNKTIIDNPIVQSELDVDIIEIQLANSMKDMGGFSFRKILNALKSYTKLVIKLINNNYDLVYFTLSPLGFAFYKDLVLVFVLKLFNKKILYHLHGKGILEKTTNSRFQKKLYSYVFKNTEVIMLAKVLYKDIENVSPTKPRIIPNGIPKIEKQKSKDKGTNTKFIYLSNLVESKGILIFVEALKLLKEKTADFKAIIVGNSADISVEYLKKLVKKYNLEEFVTINGPAYGEEKYQKLAESDIFVLPTFYKNECFPLTILEAYQSGLTVISTDNGAISDIIKDGVNGFLVKSKDPNDLASKMQYCVENFDKVRAMSLNNHNEYVDKYTEEIFISNFMTEINAILKS